MCTHMYLLCMCVRCVSAHVHAALLCLEGTVYVCVAKLQNKFSDSPHKVDHMH